MDFFNIDYEFLVKQLLPVRLRQPKLTAWLNSMISPVKWLHARFLEKREQDQYFLVHNSQVVFLEAVLNDTFDPVGRGIAITDGTYLDPIYTFTVPESNPIWLATGTEVGGTLYTAPQVLYTNGETSTEGNAFIINVPLAVTFDEERMRAVVNRYRLAGKRIFQIVSV